MGFLVLGSEPGMPTVVTKTVKPAGGGDYLSLNAAITGEKAIRADLVTRNEVLQLECYAGSDTTAATIDGFVTDPDHYIRVYVASGEGHVGLWNDAKYKLDVTNANALVISDNFVRVEGLQVRLNQTAAATTRAVTVGSALVSGAYDIRLINCYLRGNLSGSNGCDGFINSNTDDGNGKVYLVNCVAEGFHDLATSCVGFNFRSAPTLQSVFAYNCTSIRCQTGFQVRSYVRYKNCGAIDAWSAFPANTAHASSTNNGATRKSTASMGSNFKQPVAVLMKDPLAADYRLQTGDSGFKANGVDLSADANFAFDYDITGATRTGTWSIGAYQESNAAVQDVVWLWAGGVKTTTAQVKVRLVLAEATSTVNLRVSTASDLSNPTIFGPVSAPSSSNNVATFNLTGLSANTTYYYGVTIGVTTYTRKGKFKTTPSGAASFVFAVGGDSDTGGADPVFDEIRTQNPLFFMYLGDAHYQDVATNDITEFRKAYDLTLLATPQLNMFLNTAVDYVWDHHDFGGANSNKNATAKPAAQDAYRENAAHHTLPAGDPGQFAIYHSFVVGRVRFIVTDMRSERNPNSDTDNGSKTMMGATQKQWLKDEILAAKTAGQAVIWMSPIPWVAATSAGQDHWGGFNTERKEIADFLQSNNVDFLIRISANAHMVALDDGTNDKFTTDAVGNGLTTFHAAPLRQNGSTVGGPYSHNTFSGTGNESEGQYGLVTVTDTGANTISVQMVGKKYQTQLLTYTKVLNVPTAGSGGPTGSTKTVTAAGSLGTKTVVKTVKPNGGGDYISIAAALAAEKVIRPNLVSNDEILLLECYSGRDVGGTATIDTFTVDATHYVKIAPAAGHGCPGFWDETKYYLDVTNVNGIVINRNYVRLDRGLQVKLNVTSAVTVRAVTVGTGLAGGAYDIRVINCYMKGVLSGTNGCDGFINSNTDDASGKVYVVNCVADGFRDKATACVGFNVRSAPTLQSVFMYNCTAINCHQAFQPRSYLRAKNCAAIDAWSAFPSGTSAHASSTNNAATKSNTATMGANFRAYAAVYMRDSLFGDYRLDAGDTSLKGNGADLSADSDYAFSTDIADVPRPAGAWSIGAFEPTGVATQSARWAWVSGVTTTGAVIKVRMNKAEETAVVRLRVSRSANLSNPFIFGPVTAKAADNQVATFVLNSLSPDAQYYYGVDTGGAPYVRQGKFKTFPTGTASFTFAMAGDQEGGAADPVYADIKAIDPLFFILNGDFHYQDLSTNDQALQRAAYENNRLAGPQADHALSMPLVYVWDDHDWGGDASNKNAVAGPAAAAAYRENAASYPLAHATAIYQSFVVGRCRFVVTDLRSQRNPNSDTDNSSKTMMGTTQKQWFKDELLAAKAAGQVVFWVCEVPWVIATAGGDDTWAGFNTERKELADFMQANNIVNLVRLSADAHMVALDDGTNDKFTTDAVGNGMMTFHAAPIRQSGSTKGGPYSHGTFAGTGNDSEGQWGKVVVADNGGTTITVTVTGYKASTQLVTLAKNYTVPSPQVTAVLPGFYVAFADANGDRIVGSEVLLSPTPVAVEYPKEPLGQTVTTADGRAIQQLSSKDNRARAWIWRNYPEEMFKYRDLWNLLQALRSRQRVRYGAPTPYIYVRDTMSQELRRQRTYTGVASATGFNTITDSSQNWDINALVGWEIELVDGLGSGQRRKVVSNTATQVTVDSNWTVQPGLDTHYVLRTWINDWFRARVTSVARVPRDGGRLTMDETRFEFVIDDTLFDNLG